MQPQKLRIAYFLFLMIFLLQRQRALPFQQLYHFLITEEEFRLRRRNRQLLVFSVTPFKIGQNKKLKPFNRLSPESGNRKRVHMQRLSPRFRSQQFFLSKTCEEMF